MRETSIEQLNQTVAALQEQAEQAAQAVETVKAKHAEMVEKFSGDSENEASTAELEKLYQEQKAKVDPGFLSHYERLMKSGNKLPLMKLNSTHPGHAAGQHDQHIGSRKGTTGRHGAGSDDQFDPLYRR